MKKFNKYKKLFKEQEEGLKVFGKSSLDNKKIGDVIELEGCYAKWDKIGKFWFFPKLHQYYNSLEKEIRKLFDKKNIKYHISYRRCYLD